ncbi:MAG: hypothetical protein N3A61_03520 [Ignavibacteria bacterium]|nr:hypothetical protein [Ignavibacteria bacterium]
MKLLVLNLLILFSGLVFAQSKINSKYIETPIQVDGNISDWDYAEWITFKPQDLNWKDSALVSTMWDENYLYIAFKVFNTNLQALKTERDAVGLYMDDGVEFLIDANLDKTHLWQDDDIAYHINVLNYIIDDRGMDSKGGYNNDWNGEAITSVKVNGSVNDTSDIDEGYTVEAAIPWVEINKTPLVGLKMGIDFCVNDRDDITGKYRYYDWMNLKKFHVPSGFGIIELVK